MNSGQPGVADFVLATDLSEETIVDNLRVRFDADVVYTFIGSVIVAINPYKPLNIYKPSDITRYRGSNMFELPPHIYSVAEAAYKSLLSHTRDQCVLITGESGAGKTEASKILLGYVAGSGAGAAVRERLVAASPCLEAFGNATTIRNDNSSRFGKYMELEFDFRGTPVGGRITSYLLEKSRVTQHSQNERSFHVFYQLLAGAPDSQLSSLGLQRNPSHYAYLRGATGNSAHDAAEHASVKAAFEHVGVDSDTVARWMDVVAAVLHLGNVRFDSVGEVDDSAGAVERTEVVGELELTGTAELLGLGMEALEKVLTTRSVFDSAKKDRIVVPLNPVQAAQTRDALAKTLYGRLFSHVVASLNACISAQAGKTPFSVLGVLDIFGFEVMEHNGFEQLCINYCNEKLQQLFIELTLKAEQVEYEKEGIEWTEIPYFNNETICELIEAKPLGLIALLDEESKMVGTPTATSLLRKFDIHLSNHPHYESRSKQSRFKSSANLTGSSSNLLERASSSNALERAGSSTALAAKRMLTHNEFMLKHFAADVVYETAGFLETNRDELHQDVAAAMGRSSHAVVKKLFAVVERDPDAKGKRTDGETLASQFKKSLAGLVQNLMKKNPHYIRCVKPNGNKEPGVFDWEIVRHQCRYLGLRESILVRRAGFCYRAPFAKFLSRYKMLGPDRSSTEAGTWPNQAPGHSARDGLIQVLEESGVHPDEYRLGKTKVFLRHPNTLVRLEANRMQCTEALATLLKAVWKGKRVRQRYLLQSKGIVAIQARVRTRQAVARLAKARHAAKTIQRHVRGYLARRSYRTLRRRLPKFAAMVIQHVWRRHAGRTYLLATSTAIRTASPHWRAIIWPAPPPRSAVARTTLQTCVKKSWTKRYRDTLAPERKTALLWKTAALDGFGRKRGAVEAAMGREFGKDRFGLADGIVKSKSVADPLLLAFPGTKHHRSNPSKTVSRTIALTTTTLHLLDAKGTSSTSIRLSDLTALSISDAEDGILVVHCPGSKGSKEKGDWIVGCGDCGTSVELASRIMVLSKEAGTSLEVNVGPRLSAKFADGHTMVLLFSTITAPPALPSASRSPQSSPVSPMIRKSKGDTWTVISVNSGPSSIRASG